MPRKTTKPTLTQRADAAEARVRIERANLATRALREQGKVLASLAGVRRGSIPRAGATSVRQGPAASFGSYDAAVKTRLNQQRSAPLAPADAHLDSRTLDAIRRDTQGLYRNNPLARAIVSRMADAVCGPQGPNLVLMSSDDEWNREASAKFWRWASNADRGPGESFDALGRQSLMSAVRAIPVSWQIDGDIGCIYLTDGSCRLVEASEIASPPRLGNGPEVVNGIELDGDGRPAAVWLAHASDSRGYDRRKFSRMPWGAVTLLPNPTHRRLNQIRGEPGLAACLRLLDLVDDGIDATILAYRAAVYTALVHKVADPRSFIDSAISQTAAVDGASNPAESGAPQDIAWEPLGTMVIGPDDDIKQIDPKHPTQQFDPFLKTLVRYIGADPGLPLELVMLDASQTNYHGFKSAVGNAYRGIAWQQFVIGEWLHTLAAWRLGLWIQSGELSGAPADWDAFDWRFPGPPIIDPKLEAEAGVIAFSQRQKSREQILTDQGYTGSVADLDRKIAAELARMRELGIEPVAMPGSPQAAANPTTP